jgi:hypothetical protein
MPDGSKDQKRRITFIESDDSPDALRKAYPKQNLVEVELFVRKPDNVDADEFAVAARLCGCRRICVAIVELE